MKGNNEAFWFAVLQIALAENSVQSISKASEVSHRSIEETIELANAIEKLSKKVVI